MEIADIIIRGLDSAELDVLGIKTVSVEVRSLPYTGADIFMQGQFFGSSNFKFDHVLTGNITMKVLINGEIIEEMLI